MNEWRFISPSHPLAINLQDVPGVEWEEKLVKIHRSHEGLIRNGRMELGLSETLYGKCPGVIYNDCLRDYQSKSLRFLQYRFGTLLADAPRVGKTLPATCCWSRNQPMLIVAPLAVRLVWLEWIEKVHPGANVVFVKGKEYSPKLVEGADIIFSHYNVLPYWEKFHKSEFATIIYDEIHLLSNFNS